VAGNYAAVHFTESTIASRIEQRVPGSHATVTIASSPFLYHLADNGTVEEVEARVSDVVEGDFAFQSIDVTVQDLQIDRGSLFSGKVKLDGIAKATVVATMSSEDLIQAGLAGGLQALGVFGSSAHASVQAGPNSVTVKVDGVTLNLPYSSLIPCVGSATLQHGDLVLTCSTHTLPQALAQQA